MDLKDCYEKLGGDYENVLKRFRREKMVEKFCLKFLDDPSYTTYVDRMEAQDYEEALRAIHSLKGVCQNLAFDSLYVVCHAIVNDLRQEDIASATQKRADLDDCYHQTVRVIQEYKAAHGK